MEPITYHVFVYGSGFDLEYENLFLRLRSSNFWNLKFIELT